MKTIEKPNKTIIVKHSENFDFNYVSKKVSLESFQEWCKKTVPANATDVTLELTEHWEYDDVFTNLELAWKSEEPNPSYEKQLIKYEKQLAKSREK